MSDNYWDQAMRVPRRELGVSIYFLFIVITVAQFVLFREVERVVDKLFSIGAEALCVD